MALTVASLGAACADGGGQKTSPTTPDGRLTKAEYIKQGDSICAQQLDKTSEHIPEPKADSPAEWVRYLEARQALDKPFDEQLKALRPPLGDKDVADQLSRDVVAMSAKADEALAAARAGDTRRVRDLLAQADAINDEFARRAKQYGFKECSKVE